MSTASKQEKYRAGDVVVLVGLPKQIQHPNGEKKPPTVGQIIRIKGKTVRVRLHLGNVVSRFTRFAKLGRDCRLENIARRATPREATLGARVLIETFDGAAVAS